MPEETSSIEHQTEPEKNSQENFLENTRPHVSFIKSRSPTPTAPPWSPITPIQKSSVSSTLPDFSLLDQDPKGREETYDNQDTLILPDQCIVQAPSKKFLQQPAPTSISEDENSDAIALRAALDILQIQRQKTVSDIKILREKKAKALANPASFVDALESEEAGNRDANGNGESVFFPKNSSNNQPVGVCDLTNEQSQLDGIPGPQKVARCPPINWAKYHILSEPLESTVKGGPQSSLEYGLLGHENSPADYVLAAPYRPFVDNLDRRALAIQLLHGDY